jgi:cytochrome c553
MKQHGVLKADVKQRTSTSGMPPLVSLMSRQELRDLIEYVATQSEKGAADKFIPVRQWAADKTTRA